MSDTGYIDENINEITDEKRKNPFSLQDAVKYLESVYTITQIKLKMSEEADYYIDVSENDYYLHDSLEVLLSNVKCGIMENK